MKLQYILLTTGYKRDYLDQIWSNMVGKYPQPFSLPLPLLTHTTASLILSWAQYYSKELHKACAIKLR